MVDPKFNALPVDTEDDADEARQGSESGGARTTTKPRRGLSINDTIAAGADLSVGSRGVDTSGTSVGAGAGAGMTSVRPDDKGSPAPSIVPGARGSGTTPRADTLSGQTPTTRLDVRSEGQEASGFTADQVSERAWHCWHRRGCPHGSPEVDWNQAERELRDERERQKGRGATA